LPQIWLFIAPRSGTITKRDPENPKVHSHCNMNEHRRAAKSILSIDGGGKRSRVVAGKCWISSAFKCQKPTLKCQKGGEYQNNPKEKCT